jgi:hypothetical protein
LNSKYGVSSKNTISETITTGSGIMTGGMAAGSGGLPTMNIPVVATMPMAGMMPIQQQQTGGSQSQQTSSSIATTGPQQATTGQSGGASGGSAAANGEANAQGVKTFSIKI